MDAVCIRRNVKHFRDQLKRIDPARPMSENVKEAAKLLQVAKFRQ